MVNVSGIYFNDSAVKNARRKEQASNRANTLKNVALIAAVPLAAKQVVSKVDPSITKAVADTVAVGVENIRNSVFKGLKSFYRTKIGQKVINIAGELNHKFENSKIHNALDNWGRNSKLWKKYGHGLGSKVIHELRTGKGLIKYGAIGLLAYGALKTIQNHYENKGAINERYSQ